MGFYSNVSRLTARFWSTILKEIQSQSDLNFPQTYSKLWTNSRALQTVKMSQAVWRVIWAGSGDISVSRTQSWAIACLKSLTAVVNSIAVFVWRVLCHFNASSVLTLGVSVRCSTLILCGLCTILQKKIKQHSNVRMLPSLVEQWFASYVQSKVLYCRLCCVRPPKCTLNVTKPSVKSINTQNSKLCPKLHNIRHVVSLNSNDTNGTHRFYMTVLLCKKWAMSELGDTPAWQQVFFFTLRGFTMHQLKKAFSVWNRPHWSNVIFPWS